MGELIRAFTFDRNTYRRTLDHSASFVEAHINMVKAGSSQTKVDSNAIQALASHMGVFRKESDSTYAPTAVAEGFEEIYVQERSDAFRWLMTRSLWRFVVPNGTGGGVNARARKIGVSFGFFQLLLGILVHLQALEGDQRFLYYEEMCALLNDDATWALPPLEFLTLVLERRQQMGTMVASERRGLLADLEDEYEIPRDNLNGFFRKALSQTGLFQYLHAGDTPVGVALAPALDRALQSRVRFVLDHPCAWDPETVAWQDYLALQDEDMPRDVSWTSRGAISNVVMTDEPAMEGIVDAACEAFSTANLVIERDLTQRFVSSLLTKPFVILTGLSGSGKTRLAQALAAWITQRSTASDPFKPGVVAPGSRTSYEVIASDRLTVEFRYEDLKTKVALPRPLIDEWVTCMLENDFNEATPKGDIAAAVAKTTEYSLFISNGFDSVLKAAALLQMSSSDEAAAEPGYEMVAVGSDWVSNENILGYPDALQPDRYVSTVALGLMLRALGDPARPYFLILDEMNLSHVERYFADVLSALESGEPLHLYTGDETREGVPRKLQLPPNLFVVGTVNVDETTYMFSPKVLDRANVLEFRVSFHQIQQLVRESPDVDLSLIAGQGSAFGSPFMVAARSPAPSIDDNLRARLDFELALFHDVLSGFGAEFGFRVVKELVRFVGIHRRIGGVGWTFESAMDAQILQKLLPKLHGSRRGLEPVLWALGFLCRAPREWAEVDGKERLANDADLRKTAGRAREMDEALNPLPTDSAPDIESLSDGATYPLSHNKIVRMIRLVRQNGFASFAEA